MKILGIVGLAALIAFMIGATVYTYYTDQSKNELINGFKITPLGCDKVNEDFTELRFSVANNHNQDFHVVLAIMLTVDGNIVDGKDVSFDILAGDIVEDIKVLNNGDGKNNCVVQIREISPIE